MVCVADSGPGIAEDICEQVSHRRCQGDADEQGSGLGLAITWEAVERIGGRISLETGEEGGRVSRSEYPSGPNRSSPGSEPSSDAVRIIADRAGASRSNLALEEPGDL